jgi:hypothetical protein
VTMHVDPPLAWLSMCAVDHDQPLLSRLHRVRAKCPPSSDVRGGLLAFGSQQKIRMPRFGVQRGSSRVRRDRNALRTRARGNEGR